MMLLATYTLWLRDIVRFLRQRSRVIGALGSPVIFWLLLGSGLGRSFSGDSTRPPVDGYLQYFYPGTLALIVLFTAIFSTISVIEDRQEGFLQGVLVAPVPRSAIVMGKVAGGTTLALLQAGAFLLLAPLAGVPVRLSTLPELVGVLLALGVATTGLGLLIAWWLDSMQGFHAIMNIALIPMWILSGAVFPASGASGWIRLIMLVNPMTYGVSALRLVIFPSEGHVASPGEPGLTLSVLIVVGFAALLLAADTWLVRRRG
jgi:ABC-2 type transport system permease protein